MEPERWRSTAVLPTVLLVLLLHLAVSAVSSSIDIIHNLSMVIDLNVARKFLY